MFNIESVEPVDFLGGHGVNLRYNYASGIVIPKRGACVMRIVDRKLYAMKLEGVANQYFDAVAAQFYQLVASARLRKQTRLKESDTCVVALSVPAYLNASSRLPGCPLMER